MKIKLLNDLAQAPTRGSEKAAGMDLYAAISGDGYVRILPHETVKIGTGIAIELPKGTFGAVYPRSGLATKQGLRLANSTGIIDEDYRGEIIVALYNDSDYIRIVKNGDRIAQLIVMLYVPEKIEIVDELTDTERGENGFGSTGV